MKKATRKSAATKTAKKSTPKKAAPSKGKKLPSVMRRDLVTPASAKAAAELPSRPSNWKAGASTKDQQAQPTRYARQIAVGKRFRKDYGDIGELARNFNVNGMIQPVVINQADKLIAGERRLLAWEHKDHSLRGTPLPVRVLPIDKIILGEYAENDEALRKPFTLAEAHAIQRAIEDELRPQAEARQRAGVSVRKPGQKRTEGDRASGIAAKATGKSRRTMEKYGALVTAAEAEPERFGKLQQRADETGRVDGPFKQLKALQQADKLRDSPPPLPGLGPYSAGAFDFAWPAEKDEDDPDRLARGYYPYPTMSAAQMVEFCRDKVAPILKKDFVGAFWITNYHLLHACHLPILDALGLTPRALLTYRKSKIGRGQVARNTTEHVVIASRGDVTILPFPRTDFEFAIDRKQHSLKPQSFYDLFVKSVPASRYFSLFETADRGDKWDGFGDQAPVKKPDVPAMRLVEVAAPAGMLAALDAIERGVAERVPGEDGIDGGRADSFEFNPNYHGILNLITGKKKLRLTKRGKVRLADLRAEAKRTAKDSKVERSADAETVRAALTAEFPDGVDGHVISHTSDWSGGVPGESVATCKCGVVFRAGRDLPMSGHDKLDADILAHWRDVTRAPVEKPQAEAAE